VVSLKGASMAIAGAILARRQPARLSELPIDRCLKVERGPPSRLLEALALAAASMPRSCGPAVLRSPALSAGEQSRVDVGTLDSGPLLVREL
jgi:hypothetical protein